MKQKGEIVRIEKANAILKRLLNKLFPAEYTYHDTNQADKAREQKLRWKAAVINQLKREYDCELREYWERGRAFKHCKYQSFS